MKFSKAYDKWKQAEEAENRAWQSDASRRKCGQRSTANESRNQRDHR